MKKSLLTILTTFCIYIVTAQYPITNIPQLVPPHSIYLSDYIVPGSDKYTLNIWLNDNNETDYNVRLFLEIEGEGISLKTRPDFSPPPLMLSAGGNTLYGGDIQEYFNLNNMVVSGIDEQTLLQNGALPPGMYSFCVQAFDYRRQDVSLSQHSCTTVALSKNNPPVLTYPVCGSVVPATMPTNLMFQWQSMADNSIQAEYTFTLVEVPPNMSPDDALNGSGRTMIAPGDVTTVTNNFIYDVNQLPLEVGKIYAYRVQVFDSEGFTTFENNGQSQSCFFYYGTPEGGGLALKRPNDGKRLKTKEETSTIRFAWGRPNNVIPNQEFNFEMRLVAMELNQTPEQAIASNPVLWDTLLDPGIFMAGAEVRKKLMLPYGNVFAWQVRALTDGQEFAISPVWTFNKGELMEEFKAGDVVVTVDKTTGLDLDHFSGEGTVQLKPGEDPIRVKFDDIKIVPGARNIMTEGFVYSRLDDFEVPLSFANNGTANFRGDSLLLTTKDVLLSGQIVWDYPHPTNQTGSIATIKSKSKRLRYNGGKIIGRSFFETKTFELLDPLGYTVTYYDDSFFRIINNSLTVEMHLDVTLPEKVKTPDGKRIVIPFASQTDVHFYTNDNLSTVNPINLLNGTSITMVPRSAICDLSTSKSPGNQASNVNWKGTYFGNYQLNFPQAFDQSNQLRLESNLNMDVSLSSNSAYKSWVDSQGLQYKIDHNYTSNAPKSIFNTFQDDWTALSIDIENNSVKAGHIKGEVDIPLLDATDAFSFTVPIDEDGLKPGFIDEDLSQREVVFNEAKPDLAVSMGITKAVFADNERLNLEVNLDWESVDVHLIGVTDLNLWGNGAFGFKTPNGKKGIQENVTGTYAGTYDITIDSLCAGFGAGNYALGFIGSIVLGNAESGITGNSTSNPPKFNMVSAEERPGVTTSLTTSSNTSWFSDYVDRNLVDPINNQELALSMSIEIKTAVAEVKGTIISLLNDPDWGNAFYGNLEAQVKKPKPFSLDATLLIGKQETTSYWFVELGLSAVESSEGGAPKTKPAGKTTSMANTGGLKGGGGKKPKGGGIKLGKIEIVELMGRVYHHMSHDMTTSMAGSCSLGEEEEEASGLIPDIPTPSDYFLWWNVESRHSGCSNWWRGRTRLRCIGNLFR